MAVLNRDMPYGHAHGLVQDHEPFFFQNGCAFTSSGVEVFKDRMGNFSLSAEEAEALATELAAEAKAKEDAEAAAIVLAEAEAEALATTQAHPVEEAVAAEVAPAKKTKIAKDEPVQPAEDSI
jgi:hypothetical protein